MDKSFVNKIYIIFSVIFFVLSIVLSLYIVNYTSSNKIQKTKTEYKVITTNQDIGSSGVDDANVENIVTSDIQLAFLNSQSQEVYVVDQNNKFIKSIYKNVNPKKYITLATYCKSKNTLAYVSRQKNDKDMVDEIYLVDLKDNTEKLIDTYTEKEGQYYRGIKEIGEFDENCNIFSYRNIQEASNILNVYSLKLSKKMELPDLSIEFSPLSDYLVIFRYPSHLGDGYFSTLSFDSLEKMIGRGKYIESIIEPKNISNISIGETYDFVFNYELTPSFSYINFLDNNQIVLNYFKDGKDVVSLIYDKLNNTWTKSNEIITYFNSKSRYIFQLSQEEYTLSDHDENGILIKNHDYTVVIPSINFVKSIPGRKNIFAGWYNF